MYEPRGYVYEVGFFVRYSSPRDPTAIFPAQRHAGAPLRRSARQWPRYGSVGSRFFARSGRNTAPAPPAVCAHSAAPARPLAPKGREGTATCAPATCQILLSAQMATRKNDIFRLGQLLLLRRALEPPPPPGADMLPTTSSDPEGFRSRPIAFWKALEPLSKAYISTSTLHCDLRISNGHTACGCERGYRRRRGIDGAAETDVAEAGTYGHSAPDSLAPTLKVASVKSNDWKSLRACSHHPHAFPRAQNPPHAIGHFEHPIQPRQR